MKQAKHTPGPWTAVPNSDAEVDLCHIKAKETGIALTTNANGALIAAAPEMLEALERGVSELMKAYKVTTKLEMQDVDGGAFVNETVMRLNEVLKNAIAKARGE